MVRASKLIKIIGFDQNAYSLDYNISHEEAALGVNVSEWREFDCGVDKLKDLFSRDVFFFMTGGGLTWIIILNPAPHFCNLVILGPFRLVQNPYSVCLRI